MPHAFKTKFLLLALLVLGSTFFLRPVTAAPAEPAEPAAHVEREVSGGHVTDSGAFYAEPPASPTRVKLGVYLIGLTEISPPQEAFPTFRAELFLDVKWHDPRLAFDVTRAGVKKEVFQDADVEKRLHLMWRPDLEIENEQGHRTIESRELAIHQDGTVEYTERSSALMHAEVDLRNFPFDTQVFTVELESFEWDETAVVFEPYTERIGYNAEHHTLEWKIQEVSHEISSSKEVRADHPFSKFSFRIHAERDPGYYIWKIVVPLLLIIVLTWSTFWMKGESSDIRMERNYISLLTVVAFHQIVSSNLPKISYLTFLDGIVFVAFSVVGATVVHMIVTQRAQFAGDVGKIERMDRRARWLFPVVLTAALLALWTFYHSTHGGSGHA